MRVPKDTPVVVYSSAGYRGPGWPAGWGAGVPKLRVMNLGSLFQWVNEGRPDLGALSGDRSGRGGAPL